MMSAPISMVKAQPWEAIPRARMLHRRIEFDRAQAQSGHHRLNDLRLFDLEYSLNAPKMKFTFRD